ncbi:MAG: signal transduction histidine kinase [Planctomycetota bacterium]|jgi:signal transduction histidine kinase
MTEYEPHQNGTGAGRPGSDGSLLPKAGSEFQENSILHDVRNLLFVIQSLLAEAHQASPSSLEMSRILHELDSAVTCAAQISRPGPSRRESTDLTSLLSQAAALIRRSSPAGVHVEFECGGSELFSIVDRSALTRVMLEICNNALSAMPTGGRLRVSLKSRDLDVETLVTPKPIPAGSYAVIEVQDNGGGMSTEELDSAFEPGFTRRVGHSGLGLAIASGAIGRQGGGVRLTSKAGVGTAVELFLPLQEDQEFGAVAPPSRFDGQWPTPKRRLSPPGKGPPFPCNPRIAPG